MKTIWKYPLELKDEQIIEVPVSSEFLHVGLQNDKICLWALVNSNSNYPLVKKTILIRGTGHDIGGYYTKKDYIGTVQQGQFVWHVFNGEVE